MSINLFRETWNENSATNTTVYRFISQTKENMYSVHVWSTPILLWLHKNILQFINSLTNACKAKSEIDNWCNIWLSNCCLNKTCCLLLRLSKLKYHNFLWLFFYLLPHPSPPLPHPGKKGKGGRNIIEAKAVAVHCVFNNNGLNFTIRWILVSCFLILYVFKQLGVGEK